MKRLHHLLIISIAIQFAFSTQASLANQEKEKPDQKQKTTKKSSIKPQSKPEFYPLPNGAPGIMDQKMKDFLESTSNFPSQKSLDSMLANVTHIKVLEDKHVVTIEDPAQIASFRRCLTIEEDKNSFFHCMCFGNPQIKLFNGKQEIAHLSCQHGFGLRWENGWKWDARLVHGEQLTNWLAQNGATQLKTEVSEAQEQKEQSERDWEKWKSATPLALRDFVEKQRDTDSDTSKENSPKYIKQWDAMNSSYKSTDEKILAVLRWYGSKFGEWSGYPGYETLPANMLLDFDTATIVKALKSRQLDEAELEGAARFFSSWQFSTKRKNGVSELPEDIKSSLLTHSLKSKEEFNRIHAKNTFGEKK